jgi:putative transposase
MSTSKKELLPNYYYHIYNRGNGKNRIFLDENDYNRFIKLLYLYNTERKFRFRDVITYPKIDSWNFDGGSPIIDICAWVLMPNHFHLVVISHRSDLWKLNNNPVTEFMRKVFTSYSMYFNKKYNRKGSLFESKFKAKLINRENYFNYIFSYIHLNPIKLIQKDWKENGIINKEEAIEFLKKYKYSSFLDFFGIKRKESKIISNNSVPGYIRECNTVDLFTWFELKNEVN